MISACRFLFLHNGLGPWCIMANSLLRIAKRPIFEMCA
jgi:hypothetical protein